MNLHSILKTELKNIKNAKVIEKDNQVIVKVNLQNIIEVLKELKNNENLKFWQLSELTAVDYPQSLAKFDVIYVLLSHEKNYRIVVRLALKEKEDALSIQNIYPSANWFEREVFDMFGIEFKNHPNLKRILNEDDFEGFPLLKNFPTQGNFELFYDEEKQEFIQKDISIENTESFSINDFMGGSND